jgi:hypothetical protein
MKLFSPASTFVAVAVALCTGCAKNNDEAAPSPTSGADVAATPAAPATTIAPAPPMPSGPGGVTPPSQTPGAAEPAGSEVQFR